MGVKVLVLAAFLVLSASVNAQDVVVTERTVDESPLDVETQPEVPQPADLPQPDVVPEESAVEVIPDAPADVVVRSGKYQLNDGLVGEEPAELEAVDVDPNGDQSEKQMLYYPDSTVNTNYNEYGKSF